MDRKRHDTRNPGRELGLAALAGAVAGYRRIPPRVRRKWSFGASTSHEGLAVIRHPQATFWRALAVIALMAVPRMHGPFAWDWDHPG